MKLPNGKLYCSVKKQYFKEYDYQRGWSHTDYARYCPCCGLKMAFNKDHKILWDKGFRP